MKYNKKSVDSTQIQETYKTSTLVSKVFAFHQCTEDQIKELLSEPTGLTKNTSEVLKHVVDRLREAKDKNEKVFVGGDYDADGICATSIMIDTLNQLGIENGYYIPNRFKEGYGLHSAIVQQAFDKGYRIIITVDNGVKAHESLLLAKKLGIEVIILDHHEIEETPECTYLLHPDVFDNPFKGLSGAGVTLQVASELVGICPLHLALACVATIGDVMNLWQENRTIVKLGLKILNEHSLAHFDALLDQSKKVITEKDIAFQIVPKLNAVGRLQEMANPNNVVKFFLETNTTTIQQFAKQMVDLNNKRKQMTLQMTVLAEKKKLDDDFIIIHDERFHEGLVGLLAGKLANKYRKPTLVFTEKEDVYKGSGRSIKGFDMYSFFSLGFEEEFSAFGGHSQAVGCSVRKDVFESLKKKVAMKYATLNRQEERSEDACLVDAQDITLESVQEYLSLAPFGQGFSEVVFAIENCKIKSTQLIKQKFLKVNFENKCEGIWFDYDGVSEVKDSNTVFAECTINEFIGQRKCSLIIKNID